MKICILGGSGFIGSNIAENLLEKGHQVVLLVRPGSSDKIPVTDGLSVISGDASDPDALLRAISGCDTVIYSIGLLRQFPKQGILFFDAHFRWTQRAIEAAKMAGARRFIYISANGAESGTTEYFTTKRMAEDYLADSGLDWTVFRPSVVFGPPRRKMEFCTQLRDSLVKPYLPVPLFFRGFNILDAGRFRFSPVHIDDLAEVVTSSLTIPETSGKIFPLGGPETFTWNSIIKLIAQASGRKKLYLPVPAAPVRMAAHLLGRFFPIAADQLDTLLDGNVCDSSELFDLCGISTPIHLNSSSLAYLRA